MDLDRTKIREICTEAVFKRGQDYRDEGHVQRIERFGDVATAAVRGTNLYDVTVELGENTIDARYSKLSRVRTANQRGAVPTCAQRP